MLASVRYALACRERLIDPAAMLLESPLSHDKLKRIEH
jgi:hypothetical protein